MLMIEILKIIASFSITIALFYTFFKVGRLSAYENASSSILKMP